MTPNALLALLPMLSDLVRRLVPDPAQRDQAQAELVRQFTAGELAPLQGAINAMLAELQGNWLQRSWRPLLMLTFGGLIVARWFGLVAPGLSEAEYLELWGIVKLGLGGYVVGRSVEKTAPAIVSAIQVAKR